MNNKKNNKMKFKKKKTPFLKDMGAVLSDPRFSHVGSDPKLRYISKEKKKVKIDERFSSLMTVSILTLFFINLSIFAYMFFTSSSALSLLFFLKMLYNCNNTIECLM